MTLREFLESIHVHPNALLDSEIGKQSRDAPRAAVSIRIASEPGIHEIEILIPSYQEG